MSIYYANEIDEYLAHAGVKGMKKGQHVMARDPDYLRRIRNGKYISRKVNTGKYVDDEYAKNLAANSKHNNYSGSSKVKPNVTSSSKGKGNYFTYSKVLGKTIPISDEKQAFLTKYHSKSSQRKRKAKAALFKARGMAKRGVATARRTAIGVSNRAKNRAASAVNSASKKLKKTKRYARAEVASAKIRAKSAVNRLRKRFIR